MATEYDRDRGARDRTSASNSAGWIIGAVVVAAILAMLYFAMADRPLVNTTTPTTTTSQPRVTTPPENKTVTPTTTPAPAPSTK